MRRMRVCACLSVCVCVHVGLCVFFLAYMRSYRAGYRGSVYLHTGIPPFLMQLLMVAQISTCVNVQILMPATH